MVVVKKLLSWLRLINVVCVVGAEINCVRCKTGKKWGSCAVC